MTFTSFGRIQLELLLPKFDTSYGHASNTHTKPLLLKLCCLACLTTDPCGFLCMSDDIASSTLIKVMWSDPMYSSLIKSEKPGKYYTGEGSASFETLEKPVWRPKGRQLIKFSSMLFTILKTNCCIFLSCLPPGLQSCFQVVWSFPLKKISPKKRACLKRRHVYVAAWPCGRVAEINFWFVWQISYPPANGAS